MPPRLALAGMVLLLVADSWLWVGFQDYTFHRLDDVQHLNNAWSYLHAFARGELLPDNPSHYPPLVPVVTALFCALTGRPTAGAAVLSLALFTPLLLWGVYRTALQSGMSGRHSLLAAWVAGTSSSILYFSRVYYLDVPLTAMVMAALALLLGSEGLARRSAAALFAVTAALGLLTKWTFGLFLVGPVLARSRHLPSLLMVAAIVAGVAFPWYSMHLQAVTESYRHLASEVAAPLDLVFYARRFLLPHLLLAFVAGVAWCLSSRERTQRFLPLLLAIAVPYVVYSWMPVKDPRFMLPAVPCAAILAVAWLPALGRWQALVAVPLALAGFVGAFAWVASPPEGPSRVAALLLGEPRLARLTRFDYRDPLLGPGREFDAMIVDLAGRPGALSLSLDGNEHHPVLSALYARTGRGTVHVQLSGGPWRAWALEGLRRSDAEGSPPPGWLLVQEGRPVPQGEPVATWTVDFAESWRETVRFRLYRIAQPSSRASLSRTSASCSSSCATLSSSSPTGLRRGAAGASSA